MSASGRRERVTLEPDGRATLAACSAAVVGVHLAFAGRYGFFRDELYFIACGARPSFGYADQPPLLPLLAFGWDALVGGSLLGFRLLPALIAGALALVTGRLARQLGAGAVGAVLAAVAVSVGPVFLVATHLLTVNTLEPVSWTLLVLLVLRLLERPTLRRWLGVGALIGVGLLNKYSMAFWALSLVLGLAASPRRRVLASVGLGAALLVACALPLPSLVWQAQHGWPFLELLRAGAGGKNAPFELVGFVTECVLSVHPLTLPLWLVGLVWLWRNERWVAVAFLGFFTAMIALKAKPYYAAPAFPTLLAAGAAAAERHLVPHAQSPRRGRRAGAFTALLAGGALLAPLAVPILPIDTLIRYQHALGVSPAPLENKEYGALAQHVADQFGWPEIAARVSDAWGELDPGERERAAVFSFNYGDASAIARFASLPSISGHNQYGEWGPGRADGSVLVVLGGSEPLLARAYASVVRVGTGPSSPYMMPYERAQPIWIVRRPRLPWSEIWRRARHID